MSCVDLDQVQAGSQGPGRGHPPGVHDLVDLGQRQLVGHPPLLIKGQRAGRHRLFGAVALIGAPRFAPGVGKLDANGRPLGLHQARHAGQGLDLGIIPQAQVVLADPPSRLDGGGLDDQQACSPGGPGGVVSQVPVGHQAIVSGSVHAHGREHNAVAQGQPAQGVWREKMGHQQSSGVEFSRAAARTRGPWRALPPAPHRPWAGISPPHRGSWAAGGHPRR